MADLQLVTGTFRSFRATVRFHLGKIQQDVIKDDVVEFDGTTLKVGGVSHALPELRSAIKAGWLAPVESSVADYVSQSANVKVRAAMDKDKGKTVSTEVQQDETFVGSARKASTTDGVKIETKAFNPTVVRDTEGDGRTVGPSTKKSVPTGGDATEGEPVAKIKTAAKKSFTLDGSTSMNADSDTGTDVTGVVEHLKGVTSKVIPSEGDSITREGQSSDGGKVIANVKTAAKRKVTLTDANDVDREINNLENSTRVALAPKGKRDIAALAGDTLEDIVPANEPENRGRMLAEQAKARRIAALKAEEAGEKSRTLAKYAEKLREESLLMDELDPVPTERDLLVEERTSRLTDPPPPPVKVVAKPPKSVEDFAVNGDELELAPGVRWNKKLHWKTRVKQALQYRDQPEVLNLIRGNEVESVVKAIDAALTSGG
jgi:hypothetical protein